MSSRMPKPEVSVFLEEEGGEVAWLSLQEMENFSTEDRRSRLEKEFTGRSVLSH